MRKAIRTKRITPEPDGTIDAERADREWAKNTFASRTVQALSGQPVAEQVQRMEAGDPISAYLKARAVTETFKAKTAQLTYEELAGKLIQTTKAAEYAVQFSSLVGEVLCAWPDRLTPLIAALTDEVVIHKLLSNEVAGLRGKLSRQIANAGL